MKKQIILSAALFLSVSGFAGIKMEGSTTVLPLAQKTAEVYMDANPEADISIRGGGSGVGINSLLAGTTDIANSSRAMKEAELKKAAGKNITPKATVVCMDAIALIVHPSNSAGALSKAQIKDIFTGKIKNWKQVGGPDLKIVLVSRDSASGTFEAFTELALQGAKTARSALMQASNQGVGGVVSKTPGAIGYVGLGYLTDKTKTITIGGVAPSVETVLNKTYAYSRPLFMYTNGMPTGGIKAYIDFVIGKQGQEIASELGFVPLITAKPAQEEPVKILAEKSSKETSNKI